MNLILQWFSILGFLITLIAVIVHYQVPTDDREWHIRVGKEWMTVAEYRKRYCPLPEPIALDKKLEVLQKVS